MTRARKSAKPRPSRAAHAKHDDSLLDDFRADWQAHGPQTIAALRTDKPSDYVRIAASVLVKDANHKADPLDGLTDAELAERIAKVAASLGLDIRPRASARRAGEADEEDSSQR